MVSDEVVIVAVRAFYKAWPVDSPRRAGKTFAAMRAAIEAADKARLQKEQVMNSNMKRAAQYVRNTNGGATLTTFIEDHEPIGEILWTSLAKYGYVRIVGNKVVLTERGAAALTEAEQKV